MARKQLVGRVVSDKMQKTAVVSVEIAKRHPLYEKVVRRNKKYKVHDENNEARVGDLVRIEECRPMSKEKRFQIVEWLEHAEAVEA
jgi:small subunit ribosomal protein S17